MEKRGRSSSAPIVRHDCPQQQDDRLPNYKKDFAHHVDQIKGASLSSAHAKIGFSRTNGRERASTFSAQLQGNGNTTGGTCSQEAGKNSSLIAAPAHEYLSSNNEERDQPSSALPESDSRARKLFNAAPAIVQRRLSAVVTAIEDLFPSESYRAPNREDSAGTLDIDTFGNFDGDDEKPVNPKRVLTRRELVVQRVLFAAAMISLNAVLVVLSALGYSGTDFQAFDLVFCTDADSTIHQGAIASLADTCLAEPSAIAACGFVFVEYEPGKEWSVWNLIQQFQYAFGQVVRRGAESAFGKVTCLPGCITMLVVRPEMAGAMEKYAAPVTSSPVFRHQVQYLGTDRRLTYSMLSQGKHLHTFFVPGAGSETVAPQSLKHYLSQRRRWGSNAYFNNLWYLFGENMILITRLFAVVETVRLTMVYFRLANTVLFLYGFSRGFKIAELLPTIGILLLPLFWFLYVVSFENRHLRSLLHKLVIGGLVTRCVSPILSMLIFSIVMKNLGSAQWGVSGITASSTASKPTAPPVSQETHEQNLDVQRRLEEGQQIQPQACNSDEGPADMKAHAEKDKPSL
ncbi:glycosyltransferase family 2 protein [Hortaea werneckii]|nr:glycosyltransferase family 2 protein [Hortaea werneckii]KAI7719334.1 glycosyltransferase family 2 protein [Hortaea werneckii]